MADHFDTAVNTAVVDTLTWHFYKGIGWPYDDIRDTLQTDLVYFKEFGFKVRAPAR